MHYTARVNWHGFKRLGGFQLGLWVSYPYDGIWIIKASALVVTIAINIRNK